MVICCPECGAEAPDDQSLFCNICGTQLPVNVTPDSGITCPQCSAKIPDRNAVECARCGFRLSSKPPPVQSARPTKNCPQCGAPVPDESRYYCNSCGAYIRNAQARKVALAVDPSGVKTTIKKPVIVPGSYQNTGTNTHAGTTSGVTKRNIDLANPMLKKTGIIVVVIAGIALLIWGGSMLFGSGSLLQSENDVLITQDLGSITLLPSDFPSGWMSGEAGGTEDVYSAQFFTSSENNEALVEQTITRFPGIEEARLELNSEREQVTGVTVETINLGNGGFGYIDANYVMIIFRRGNIIVKIEDTRTEYQENPTMNNAKNYAEIVAGRIK